MYSVIGSEPWSPEGAATGENGVPPVRARSLDANLGNHRPLISLAPSRASFATFAIKSLP
jgi:hypothetical protein